MTKNKDISIRPSKGISIVIRNDVQQPQAIPKKKRKYKRKANTDILKMPTIPSFIPAGDVSYIKPQYSTSSLNRNMIFPGTPQSSRLGPYNCFHESLVEPTIPSSPPAPHLVLLGSLMPFPALSPSFNSKFFMVERLETHCGIGGYFKREFVMRS